MSKDSRLSVLDLFCGAGGFSEGFREQGFRIAMGIDSWKPAMDTFNYNFQLSCNPRNILELSIKDIEGLPNTDVIIGSPPCVSFSNSNRSGKANKSMGLRLTESFLRIVAIKKFGSNSMLKAWFMENVPNSLKFIKRRYTFKSLGLKDWAIENNIDPSSNAIVISGNSCVINAADYGSPQCRKRAITGEIIRRGKLIEPAPTHNNGGTNGLKKWITLQDIRRVLPSPYHKRARKKICDPLFSIQVKLSELTDHFYDTGLYESEWRASKFHKRNHPYMGRMSFPENEKKPSRTITAMNIGTSRETMIFRSELQRKAHGKFRQPTVREMACLMGFPITYQFTGSESSKVKQVGNAVCPSVSRALARLVLLETGLTPPKAPLLLKIGSSSEVANLNTYCVKRFDSPPLKKRGSRFRKHPFKYGNMTVTLSNYDIQSKESSGRWITSIQYGNGHGYPTTNYFDNYYKKLERTIKSFNKGKAFLRLINNGFSEKIADGQKLQLMHEEQRSIEEFLEPGKLVEEVARIIQSLNCDGQTYVQKGMEIFKYKEEIPQSQILALYAINKIASKANQEQCL